MASEERGPSTEPVKAEEGALAAIVPVSEPAIRDLIYTVRGTQVMLDSDLAMLYGVETRIINQAVRRNQERFPEHFCFQLSKDEWGVSKSQTVTSKRAEGSGGRRKLPNMFTEQGVAMLSAVLRSETAIRVSVQIMDAFVEMRHFIAGNAAMFEQIRAVELCQLEYQRTTDERIEDEESVRAVLARLER
ncbi:MULTISPECIES: ORF6N domain-containing protein [unclassified Adlercreutzia]|uniref:ORF6N domain-containing protein n=1 Tax=unclassified Adlercreutzia TaxID=2636013 RepID=UPI0013EB7DA7|nr:MULTISPECIES: ORF6N domain-containing protein [unclassified Adlercreutzia]